MRHILVPLKLAVWSSSHNHSHNPKHYCNDSKKPKNLWQFALFIQDLMVCLPLPEDYILWHFARSNRYYKLLKPWPLFFWLLVHSVKRHINSLSSNSENYCSGFILCLSIFFPHIWISSENQLFPNENSDLCLHIPPDWCWMSLFIPVL